MNLLAISHYFLILLDSGSDALRLGIEINREPIALLHRRPDDQLSHLIL